MDEACDLTLMHLISSMEISDSSETHFGSLGEGIHDGGLGENIHYGSLGEGINDG